MNKVKLVLISEALGGGVRRHLLDLLYGIDMKVFEVHVIYSMERADSIFTASLGPLTEKGITFHLIKGFSNSISLTHDIKALIGMIKLIRKIKPDIVHCHSSKAGALGRISAKINGVKKIFYTPHAYILQNPGLGRYKKIIFYYLERVLSLLSTKNIHVSRGEEKFAIENSIVPFSKSQVIYNGISDYIYKESNMKVKQNNTFVIGTVSRMDYQKNPWLFIQIAEKVIKYNNNIKFIYVGSGEYFDEISSYIRNNNLEYNIELLGFDENPIDKVMEFNIFLSTSLYEGLPYTLIEATSCGIPIVASDIAGHDEIVENAKNGYLFKIDNIEQATNSIISLLENASMFNEFSKNSRKKYEENFHINSMLDCIEDLYLE